MPVNVREIYSSNGFVYLLSPHARSRISLRAFLATNIAGCDVLLGTPPQHLTQALQHYWSCKASDPAHTTLRVLINTNHHLFSRWQALLHSMTRVPCKGLPGFAFWVDETAPPPTQTYARNLGKPKCSMVFSGLAAGNSATFLLDSGASHCFIDQTFAESMDSYPVRVHSELHSPF